MSLAICSNEQVTGGLKNHPWVAACDYVWSYVYEVNPEGVPFQRGSVSKVYVDHYRGGRNV
jgi:hypothetical protein